MKASAPLAELLRPERPEHFLGQAHLRSRIETFLKAERLPSLLLFGPPGCGKSTLAILLAQNSGRKYLRVSAPEAGLAQLRRSLTGVEILVLDELHRFSKAQQDFFLPLLESGELVLLATTTENPSFSVTRQLLSRLHVLKFKPLAMADLLRLGNGGMERLGYEMPAQSLEALAIAARGDGRAMLNLVEYAQTLDEEARSPEKIRAALPEILARHDRDGDSHYELASALIKSIRGSDVDAALYWLAALLEGGEDPTFVCRRLILSAAEDIGLASPNALQMAVACQQAVQFVGMPEGVIPLAETVVYLAQARKSNSTYAAYLNAARKIRQNGQEPVPLHLRNATTDLQKKWGFGRDYKYPHNYPDGFVEQNYLPEKLLGERFYFPGQTGDEPRLSQWWRKIHKIHGEN